MASKSPTISSDIDPLKSFVDSTRAENRTLLIPYITAGYPSLSSFDDALDALVRGGADIIELGVPFSDPVADGPTIQRASQLSLENGVTLAWTLEALRRFRVRHDTPVVIFSYLNPIMRYGVDRFIVDAVDAGAQGLLLTDLPAGGDAPLESALESSPLSLIRLVAPTTPRSRFAEIAARAQGFIYYIARLGVTGAGGSMRSELSSEIEAMRAVSDVPIAVGFGVSTPEHARQVAAVADGVVVGSALIDAIDRGGVESASEWLLSLRRAIDT